MYDKDGSQLFSYIVGGQTENNFWSQHVFDLNVQWLIASQFLNTNIIRKSWFTVLYGPKWSMHKYTINLITHTWPRSISTLTHFIAVMISVHQICCTHILSVKRACVCVSVQGCSHCVSSLNLPLESLLSPQSSLESWDVLYGDGPDWFAGHTRMEEIWSKNI